MRGSLIHFPAPLSTRLASFQHLIARIRQKILRHAPERWNYQSARAYWEKPKDPVEYARLAACAYLLQRHASRGAVLEIGCGEALLMQHLHPDDYASWLGVDISPAAIARAQAFSGRRARYVVGDVNNIDLTDTYDAIAFSESIYHVPDPAALLRRFGRHLKPGGVLAISIYDKKNREGIWEKIHSVARPIDSSVTKNEYGRWVCEVLRMK